MATKVYDSPTTNIFALLADEHAGSSQPKKTNKGTAGANKGTEQESTPKERAEARAVQDAARKQKREAEKAQKALEAQRKIALELVDDTGFAQQRHQRLKDARKEALVEPPKSKRSRDGWDDTDSKGKVSKPWPKGDGAKGEGKGKAKSDLAGSPKTDAKAFNNKAGKGGDPKASFPKTDGKTFNKGDKTFTKSEGKGNYKGEGKVPFKNEGGVSKGAKNYDKHSQGVTGRQFQAKKQGHGKANWDEEVPAGLNSAPVKDALANEALAAPATGEVDGWGDSPAAATGADAAATTANDADKNDGKDTAKDSKKEDDEDADKKTLEEHLLDQAAKKQALEAIVKSLTPQTTITEEEKKALSKFTIFENPQAVKPEAPKPAVSTPKPATAPAPPAVATGFRVAGSRVGGRGGRFEGQRDNNTGAARPQGQRKGGRGPQKILKGQNEFPRLPGNQAK